MFHLKSSGQSLRVNSAVLVAQLSGYLTKAFSAFANKMDTPIGIPVPNQQHGSRTETAPSSIIQNHASSVELLPSLKLAAMSLNRQDAFSKTRFVSARVKSASRKG